MFSKHDAEGVLHAPKYGTRVCKELTRRRDSWDRAAGLEGAKMMHNVMVLMLSIAFQDRPMAGTVPSTMLGFILGSPSWSNKIKKI